MTGSFMTSWVMGHRNSSGAAEATSDAFSSSIFRITFPRSPSDSENEKNSRKRKGENIKMCHE